MPIYGYRCAECGHQKDVLQKLSDAPLTQCPACGAQSFSKEVSAPAFQLKGTGWYVTDFRDGNKQPSGAPTSAANGKADSAGGDTAKAADSSKADAPAPSPAPKAADAPKSPTPAAKS
tara:strand:- start:117 stop:470 length:354 start_codon:yes stop_codon:yes gene_type:complete